MKCLIAEKRPDGSYQVTTYINADGSPTITIYADENEAVLALPVFSNSITGLSKNSDRVVLYFNEDGSLNRGEANVFSVSVDDPSEASKINLDQALVSNVQALTNDVLVKEGLNPILPPVDPINPADVGGGDPIITP